jgi:antirestriction protein ArdC
VLAAGDDEEEDMTVAEAAERVAGAFESGVAPWSRPYHLRLLRGRPVWGLPVDAATGRPINGVDTWLLELSAIDGEYRNCYWATRQAWEEMGAVVVRGERTPVVGEDGDNGTRSGRILYNLEQVEVRRGGPVAALERFWVAPRTSDYDQARRLVRATGARIVTGDKPYYCRVGHRDWIEMPPDSRFSFPSDYWSVLFHELVHYVVLGLNRLCWDGDDMQGELIAEIGAAILTAHCGIPMRGHLGVYREHDLGDLVTAWIGAMRADAAYLVGACDVAWKAADFVVGMYGWGLRI